jgi:hypothetical protein
MAKYEKFEQRIHFGVLQWIKVLGELKENCWEKSHVWWLRPVIPAMWEEEVGELQSKVGPGKKYEILNEK